MRGRPTTCPPSWPTPLLPTTSTTLNTVTAHLRKSTVATTTTAIYSTSQLQLAFHHHSSLHFLSDLHLIAALAMASFSSLLVFALLSLTLTFSPLTSARPHSVSHSKPAFHAPLPQVSAASPNVTKTVLQWSRSLRTCDGAADMDVDMQGTARLIYAIGDKDPSSDTSVGFHSTMGVKNVNLMDKPSTPDIPPDSDITAVLSRPFAIDKDTLTAPSTYYHCQAFERNFTAASHIIKVTPRVDFYHSTLVHHMLLFQCDGKMSASDLAWAGNCYGKDTPKTVSACDQVHVLAGWAVGGGEFFFPPEVGFPIGPGTAYMMLQIHYHNPHGVTFNDSAGFHLTTTTTLRKYDAGTIVVHHDLATLSIPAKQSNYNVSIYTPPQCFNNIPAEGLKVFGSMLHTHETGVAVRTQHFRGGQEMPNIDSNPHYDFNFQQVVSIDPDRYPILKAGDSLKLTCTYNTLDRTAATKGGISTKDEMCMDYLWYYPAKYATNVLTVATGVKLLPTNYTTLCQMGSSRQIYNNVAPAPITNPLPVFPCQVAAGGGRVWGTPAAMNGTTGTTPITPEQWAVDKLNYEQSTVLDDEGRFVLYWNVSLDADGGNGVIRFAAEVETSGWVGLGLSASGAMVDSDSVIGWVKTAAEGAPSTFVDMTDRWNSAYSQPKIDVLQDVFDVRGVQGMFPPTPPPVNPIYYNVSVPDPLPVIPPVSSSSTPVGPPTPPTASPVNPAVTLHSFNEPVSTSSGSSASESSTSSSSLGMTLGLIAIGLTVLLAVVLAVYFYRAKKMLADSSSGMRSDAGVVGEKKGLQAWLLSPSHV